MTVHLLAFLLLAFVIAPVVKVNELSLDIVPTPRRPQQGDPTLFPGDNFYVVLTNNSEKAIRIFEDWTSLGWDSLSFEGVAANGKTYKFEKSPHGPWTRNFLAVFTIPPRGHYVFQIQFDKKNWPILEEIQHILRPSEMHFQLKAIFTESNDNGIINVWQGRVESETRGFSIFPM